MIKWVKRGLIGLSLIVGIALLVGVVFEQWSRWRVARDHEPIGRLLQVDGKNMHLHCTGAGSPTVLLEAGAGMGGSLSWALVQPEIAKTNRVCSYDRAGLLWSDSREQPPTASSIADRLHKLLEAALEKPPYVMVGHSLGGPLMMVYFDQHPQNVLGVVLVDSSHPEAMDRFSSAVQEAVGGMPPLVLMRFGAVTGLIRVAAPALVGDVPSTYRLSLDFIPQNMNGILAEMTELENMLVEARATRSFGDRPLIVLTSGRIADELPAGVTSELATELVNTWTELQMELTELSVNSERRVIEHAGHNIQFDDPDSVIEAIQDALAAVEIPVTNVWAEPVQ